MDSFSIWIVAGDYDSLVLLAVAVPAHFILQYSI